MLKRALIQLAVIICIVFALLVLLVWGLVNAAEDCPGVITPYGRIANVRPEPSLRLEPVATLAAGDTLPAHAAVRGWYLLCAGNYVSESVARYATNIPQPTPTRIAVQLLYCAEAPTITQLERGLWRITCPFR